MGRKGYKSRKLKSIIVSINNFYVTIQLNDEEVIKDKEEANKLLQLSALEFKKAYPKSKSKLKIPSYQTIKKDKINNDNSLIKKPSPENSLFVPQQIKEENFEFIQKSNSEDIKKIEISSLDKYESRIISDWDRLWGIDDQKSTNNTEVYNQINDPNTHIGNRNTFTFNFSAV